MQILHCTRKSKQGHSLIKQYFGNRITPPDSIAEMEDKYFCDNKTWPLVWRHDHFFSVPWKLKYNLKVVQGKEGCLWRFCNAFLILCKFSHVESTDYDKGFATKRFKWYEKGFWKMRSMWHSYVKQLFLLLFSTEALLIMPMQNNQLILKSIVQALFRNLNSFSLYWIKLHGYDTPIKIRFRFYYLPRSETCPAATTYCTKTWVAFYC